MRALATGTAWTYAAWHVVRELRSPWFWLWVLGFPALIIGTWIVSFVLFSPGGSHADGEEMPVTLHVVAEDAGVRELVAGTETPRVTVVVAVGDVPQGMPRLRLQGALPRPEATFDAAGVADAPRWLERSVRLRRRLALHAELPEVMARLEDRNEEEPPVQEEPSEEAEPDSKGPRGLLGLMDEFKDELAAPSIYRGLFSVLVFLVGLPGVRIGVKLKRFRSEGFLHVLRMGTPLDTIFRGEILRHVLLESIRVVPWLLILVPLGILGSFAVGALAVVDHPIRWLAPLPVVPVALTVGWTSATLMGMLSVSDRDEAADGAGAFWLSMALLLLVWRWADAEGWLGLLLLPVPLLGMLPPLVVLESSRVDHAVWWIAAIAAQAAWSVGAWRAVRALWLLDDGTWRDVVRCAWTGEPR